MGRDATHEDDEDEKRKRHRFKRVPTRNGEAGALTYSDVTSRFQNINVLGFSHLILSHTDKTAEKLKGYVSADMYW